MPPPKWRQSGEEPGHRFSLANERTFLAWIRNALALRAGGGVLVQFATALSPRWWAAWVALVAVVMAATLWPH